MCEGPALTPPALDTDPSPPASVVLPGLATPRLDSGPQSPLDDWSQRESVLIKLGWHLLDGVLCVEQSCPPYGDR